MGLGPAFSHFLASLPERFSEQDRALIADAWSVALTAHEGQLRQSGEPYATHPLAVAGILQGLVDPGPQALCAALLHDVVEDSDVPLDYLRDRFGADVAHIVDGVSKLDDVRSYDVGGAKAETLRKLVNAGGRDWRVFAVKLCDRVHNMRTLGAVGADKRRRVASETHGIFFPLARYLGFHAIALELEALSLRAMYPWRWDVIARWVAYKGLVDGRRCTRLAVAAISPCDLTSARQVDRVVSDLMVRAFQLLKHERAVRALFGVPVMSVVCGTIQSAYSRICAVHSAFVYVPASFVCDASEGYVTSKALLSQQGPVVELVAYFPPVFRDGWVRSIGDSVNTDDFTTLASTSSHSGDFTRVLREMVEDKSIVVFSPKGRRVSLPRHSSGLDFAFAIHSDIGLRTRAVRINGVLRDSSVQLTSGDVVDVVVSDEVQARAEWDSSLRSPRSRAKLRQWLRDVARSDSVALGQRLVSEATGLFDDANGVTVLGRRDFLARFSVSTVVDLFRVVGEGVVSARAVAEALKAIDQDQVVHLTNVSVGQSRVVLDGASDGGIRYCGVCMPLPGDDVLVSVSADGAYVHRRNCSVRTDRLNYGQEYVPKWASDLRQSLPAGVVVRAVDRNGLLADCARAVADAGVNVTAVHSKSYVELDRKLAVLEFSILVSEMTQLELCLTNLRTVSGVVSATRLEAGS